MANRKEFYTSEEIFAIFKEQHRLCSPLDPIADATFVLERSTTIIDWMDALDLLPLGGLTQWFNTEFRINVEYSVWKKILTPESEKNLGDLSDFLSTVAEKEIIEPVKRLGAECLSAAVFLTLKKNLKSKGVDVSQLRPSTDLVPFLSSNFSPLMEEITLTGVRVLDSLSYGELETERRFKYWIDRIFPNIIYRRPLSTGDVQTFRDLIERIMEGETLAQ